RRRTVHERTTEPFATAYHVDQATLVKGLEYAANRDAANLLDLGTTDRLPVSNNCQCLERGCRESLRARRELRALDRLGVLGARKNLPAAGELLQLDAVALDVVMLTQFVDRGGDCGGRLVRSESRKLLARDRAGAGEQRRFMLLRYRCHVLPR